MVVIGSLPLTSAARRLNPEDMKRLQTEGFAHLTISVSAYRWQSGKNRGFLREHPWHVSSWSSEPMRALCSWEDPIVTRCDMCMLGNVTWHKETDGRTDQTNDGHDGEPTCRNWQTAVDHLQRRACPRKRDNRQRPDSDGTIPT